MCLALSEPTPCSPVIEPPCCDAEVEDRAGRPSRPPRPRPRRASSKSTSGCRLPSPAWKTLATRTPDSPDSVGDRPQHLGQRGARDHAVLHDVVRADPADRGERGLAALPDQRPLGVVGGDPQLERAVLARRAARPRRTAASTSAAGPSSSTTSTAPGARRVATVDGRLGRLDRQRVHHLDRGRDHPGGDDRRDGRAGRVGVGEAGQQGLHRLGQPGQPHGRPWSRCRACPRSRRSPRAGRSRGRPGALPPSSTTVAVTGRRTRRRARGWW